MTERIRVRITKDIPEELRRWREYRRSCMEEDLSDDELDCLVKEAALVYEKEELKYYPPQRVWIDNRDSIQPAGNNGFYST